MPSAAIIGDRQSLAGFTALGVDGYAADTEAEAKAALEKAQRAGCALILVTEAAARHARVHIEAMRQKEGPPVEPAAHKEKRGKGEKLLSLATTILYQNGYKKLLRNC